MAESRASVYQDTSVSKVEVKLPAVSGGRVSGGEVAVTVRTEGEERELAGPWSMSAAVRRWGEGALEVYLPGIRKDKKKFAEQSTIVVANQAMVEGMLQQRDPDDLGSVYREYGERFKVIRFTEDRFGKHSRNDLLKAVGVMRGWASGHLKGEVSDQSALVNECATMVRGVPEESRRVGCELVILGLRTLVRRMEVNDGNIRVPIASEAVSPLTFFGIEMPDGESWRDWERTRLMLVTPLKEESAGARRTRLLNHERAFNVRIISAKARSKGGDSTATPGERIGSWESEGVRPEIARAEVAQTGMSPDELNRIAGEMGYDLRTVVTLINAGVIPRLEGVTPDVGARREEGHVGEGRGTRVGNPVGGDAVIEPGGERMTEGGWGHLLQAADERGRARRARSGNREGGEGGQTERQVLEERMRAASVPALVERDAVTQVPRAVEDLDSQIRVAVDQTGAVPVVLAQPRGRLRMVTATGHEAAAPGRRRRKKEIKEATPGRESGEWITSGKEWIALFKFLTVFIKANEKTMGQQNENVELWIKLAASVMRQQGKKAQEIRELLTEMGFKLEPKRRKRAKK